MAYLLAVIAACLLGAGFVMQQRSAAAAPNHDLPTTRLLAHLLHTPLWIGGMMAMVCGMAFSAFALAKGQVTAVEPVLAANAGFAMVVARCAGRESLGRSGWWGVALLVGGVGGFLAAARPRPGAAPSPPSQLLVLGVAVTVAALLVAAPGLLRYRALRLATAAGVLYGVQDTLTHVAAMRLDRGGLTHLAASWSPYAVLATGAAAVVFSQTAFKAGPLRISVPALTSAEPLTGIACGIGCTGDTIQHSPAALTCEIAALLSVVAGVVLTGRHPTGRAVGACVTATRLPRQRSIARGRAQVSESESPVGEMTASVTTLSTVLDTLTNRMRSP